MPGTSQNGRGVQGECDRGSAMADRPEDDGPGNRRAPPRSSPIGCRWTFVRHCGRMSAQNGGQWPGLQRHGAPVKTQTWSATGGCDHRPASRRWVQETPGSPSDMAGRSAKISVLFLVPYRGRLNWPHLHCQADAVA